ncbi:hypothetical protein J6TS2_18560 [Heyndrickxia sporothermodurans]|nr:hypothetical protein J6TS2_18560 [Heyndrickxia sporothermodurans]
MKKFLAFVTVIIVVYSVYIDLSFGTIPVITHASENMDKTVKIKKTTPFLNRKVKPGDTVLSIVENVNPSSTSISIEKIVKDFTKLNNGLKPEEIQIGQNYKFPIYEK